MNKKNLQKKKKLAAAKKNKKKFNIKGWFNGIVKELRKVVWPTKKQLINNTLTVLAVCLLIGGIIWIADFIFLEISNAVFR